ncbi:hypothetical protein PsorP6_006894 [Peronosclerospora sorghi]|uniref:Uncharacterized protein n=1 Tax=Peronosclerospora sorghi TaxID=230839 RepID=A0ACC0W9M2_9STRA|nr:hypothetical protein PsorP6_006894 [Peronosclerospora sorghi]
MKFVAPLAAVVASFALTVAADVSGGPTWGYRSNDDSLVDTSKWAETWPACGGARQSPINIVTKTASSKQKRKELPLEFSGKCRTFNLTEPEEPLAANRLTLCLGDCAVSTNGNDFDLAQFHLHVPSEHTLNGEPLDGEIHFVHKSSDGKSLLVIGIFLVLAPESNKWLDPLLDALELVNSNEYSDAVLVKLRSYSSLVKKSAKVSGIYNYPGSLTTPGCDENVDWWVVEHPVQISSIDFGRLRQDLVESRITNKGTNARPPQPLNGRVVTYYN